MSVCVVLPMGPACVNITGIRAGDLNEIQGSLTTGGIPIDLTGTTLSAQARKKSTDAEPAVTAIIAVVDPAAGTFLMRWPGDEVTTALAGAAKWTGVWDMQMQQGALDPMTVVAGTIEMLMDVTR